MKKILALLFLILFVVVFSVSKNKSDEQTLGVETTSNMWNIRSIDTMKYSRDVARQYAHESSFDKTIEEQVKNIAQTGATHVGIGTPYDEEFIPFMQRWISVIRRENMNVWFRGNLAGWEGWFEYPRIGRNGHIQGVASFIKENPDLFEDGDIFSSCPECENGGPGDPRNTGDKEAYREFIIHEYQEVQKAFEIIDVDVAANYFSMNGDVARLIMDKSTTEALDGIVVIDHYVKTPDKLDKDITILAQESGGKIVLGEWGAPIPDIHGRMSEQEQSKWIEEAISKLYRNQNVVGLNYWTSHGSSTALWNNSGDERDAVAVLTEYYKPVSKAGIFTNELGDAIAGVEIIGERFSENSFTDGTFILPAVPSQSSVLFRKEGYESRQMRIRDIPTRVVLEPIDEDLLFRVRKTLQHFIP
jgi:hypothetical protein